jgi:hypothetical protein
MRKETLCVFFSKSNIFNWLDDWGVFSCAISLAKIENKFERQK